MRPRASRRHGGLSQGWSMQGPQNRECGVVEQRRPPGAAGTPVASCHCVGACNPLASERWIEALHWHALFLTKEVFVNGTLERDVSPFRGNSTQQPRQCCSGLRPRKSRLGHNGETMYCWAYTTAYRSTCTYNPQPTKIRIATV